MNILKKLTQLIHKICNLKGVSSQKTIHLQQLRLCALNVENLFISLEYHDGSDFENMSESQWRKLALPQLRRKQKPLNKLWGLSDAIFDINPDILMLVEVGGKESLDHFNHHFLKNTYKSHFVETNSNRSIDLAFLVKKDLNLDVKVISHRETLLKIGTDYGPGTPSRFSRDVAELHIFDQQELKLILVLTHLKSKISTDRDFQGRDIRKAEAEALAAIYQNISKLHPNIPVVVGGDLNSDLASPELEALTKTDLTDFHQLLGTPIENRTSFVHFDYQGKPSLQTLDYLLVSPHLKTKVVGERSFTYRYKSFYDVPHPLPATVSARYHMPSDHFPLVLTLEL